MNWKKLGAAFLSPPLALRIILVPVSAFCLTAAMLSLPEQSPLRLASYLLAFYTLSVWCFQLPAAIRFLRQARHENPYAQIWASSPRLRINVSLAGSLLWNTAYAALQLGLGVYHRSIWFCTLAAYHSSLALMRFFLLRYTLRRRPGEQLREELRRYRACGWAFLLMNLALTGMIILMILQDRTVQHHEIVTIALAAYTFIALTMSICNVFRYRKLGSPVFSAAKAISLASACVSLLTLESTMLSTFSAELSQHTRRLFLGLSGGAISVLVIAMALYMIVKGSRQLHLMQIS